MRALLLTNVAVPYRLPLFEVLGKQLDLTVYFCQKKDAGRRWFPDLSSTNAQYVKLASRSWRLLGKGPEWVWNPDLTQRLNKNSYDIYIAGENIGNAASVTLLQNKARRSGIPFILWSGAIDTPYSGGHWASNAYRRRLYRGTNAFIAYGKRAKEFLIRRGAAAEAIFAGTQVVVPGWIWDVPPDKKALGLEGKTVALYVGYLVPRKGVADLIQAYQRARRSDSQLVIVGDGDQRAELEALAGNDEDIRFTGYLTGEEKLRYYASADLFILPTYHDPWPQVMIEALYFGLPIITTDRDGSADEVIEGNGRIVPAGDVSALTDALDQLLDNPSLRQQMGLRSRAIIADYTVETACNTFLRAIDYAQEQP